tara:strand:- start:7639 stop:8031 length:393 start_codon:yes stop_codon:yes gene_type:complete
MLLDDFYEILYIKTIDDKNIKASVKINETHKIFKGHFPDNPITPGVVLLQILKNCLEIKLGKPLLMHKLSNTKFLALVNPNFENIIDFNITISTFGNGYKIKNISYSKDGTSILKCIAIFEEYSSLTNRI